MRYSCGVERVDVAIVGAGPYGLAAAAHSVGLRSVVFGTPMSTWRRMQPDMQLRAIWEHMTLTGPAGRGTISEWMADTGTTRKDPMTPPDFISYLDWFRERYVPCHINADVESVTENGDGFHVTSIAGEWAARSLVIAVGITPFSVRPSFAALDDTRIAPATDRDRFGDLAGVNVVVVGAGQSAVEASAYALRAGAEVTLLVRRGLHWFVQRKPHDGQRLRWWLYRLAYPEQGIGPPALNRLVAHPDLYATLPGTVRDRLTARIMRSGASPWLQQRIRGKIDIREGVEVRAVEPRPEQLLLRLSDGSALGADRLFLGTGYRFSVDRLGFLDSAIRSKIAVRNDWPVLDRAFRTSDKRISLVGYPAEGTFGPFCRFVRGASFSAIRATEPLRAATR
jgi:lysine/ornithine N-monooxygenase